MYLSLKGELEQCVKSIPDSKQRIENCFFISYRYLCTVTKALASFTFPGVEEEIIFFKEIKPLFTTEIEYFNLLYHAELFKPTHSKKKLVTFFLRERSRLKRFIQLERPFYNYYKNGGTHLDELYFTKITRVDTDILSKPFNINPGLISSKDHLVSQLLSLEKYTRHVQTVLNSIRGK
jgi:hypothetical protein